MRIIAVMSPKGGIGKTTTSDSIAYMLGEEQGESACVRRRPAGRYIKDVRGI